MGEKSSAVTTDVSGLHSLGDTDIRKKEYYLIEITDQKGAIRQVHTVMPQLMAMEERGEGVRDDKAIGKREGKSAVPLVKDEVSRLRDLEEMQMTDDAAERMVIQTEDPGTRGDVGRFIVSVSAGSTLNRSLMQK